VNNAILAVAVEGLAVGILTLIAGADDAVGSIVITFVVGLWIIWLIANPDVFKNLSNALGNLSGTS
jgi:hypothetical protein